MQIHSVAQKDYKTPELCKAEYSTVESTEVMITIVNPKGSVYELCIDLAFTLYRQLQREKINPIPPL